MSEHHEAARYLIIHDAAAFLANLQMMGPHVYVMPPTPSPWRGVAGLLLSLPAAQAPVTAMQRDAPLQLHGCPH